LRYPQMKPFRVDCLNFVANSDNRHVESEAPACYGGPRNAPIPMHQM
jgi:hypothetical protein